MEKDEAKKIIGAWRTSRQRTVALWKGVEKAAIDAVRYRGRYSFGRISYDYTKGSFLTCTLPCGGKIYYAYPRIDEAITPYGQVKEVVGFWGVSAQKEKVIKGKPSWGLIRTYGGKTVENCCQAISRNLLALTMLNLEKAGFKIVMHVHDEIVAEVDEGEIHRFPEFINIMKEVPTWAKGLPLNAEGWYGKRYQK
jgi:DNA polymerase